VRGNVSARFPASQQLFFSFFDPIKFKRNKNPTAAAFSGRRCVSRAASGCTGKSMCLSVCVCVNADYANDVCMCKVDLVQR